MSTNRVKVTPSLAGDATMTIAAKDSLAYTPPPVLSIGVGVEDNSYPSPSEIQAAVKKGQHTNLFAVGDLFPVPMDGTVGALTIQGTYHACIIGMDHNKAIESAGTSNIHFKAPYTADGTQKAFTDSRVHNMVRLDQQGFCINPNNLWGSNVGGWINSYAYKTLIQQFWVALSEDWRGVVSSVVKYTDSVGNASQKASSVTKDNNLMSYLAEFEVFGVQDSANPAEQTYQRQYDYYKNGHDKSHYRFDDLQSEIAIMLRSPCCFNTDRFCSVGSSGEMVIFESCRSLGASYLFQVA